MKIYGVKANGYETVTSLNPQEFKINESLIVIIKGSLKGSVAQSLIKLLQKKVKIYLILDSLLPTDTTKYLLISQFALFGNYNVYVEEKITLDLIKSVTERVGNKDELEMFISRDISKLQTLREFILKFTDIQPNDISKLSELIKDSYSDLLDIGYGIDYIDSLLSLQEQVQSTSNTSSAENERIIQLEAEIEKLKKQSNGTMELHSYPTLDTRNVHTKAKSIVYFKEISSVNYFNSFLHYYTKYLINKKLKCKIVVYDDLEDFNNLYKGFTQVSSSTYLSNKLETLRKNNILITSKNTTILQDILQDETVDNNTIVFVVDKMHSKDDMIIGGLVKKYMLIRGQNDYVAFKDKFTGYALDNAYVISNSESIKGGIVLPKIDNYTEKSDNLKLSSYFKLEIDNEFLFNRICDAINLSQYKIV